MRLRSIVLGQMGSSRCGNRWGRGCLKGGPGNSGILGMGISWYGGVWARIVQVNLQRVRGG